MFINCLDIFSSVIPRLYSIDHVFPNSKEKNVVVIVYGELGTKSWQEMHKAAKILARSGQIQYVFRHWSRVFDIFIFINIKILVISVM